MSKLVKHVFALVAATLLVLGALCLSGCIVVNNPSNPSGQTNTPNTTWGEGGSQAGTTDPTAKYTDAEWAEAFVYGYFESRYLGKADSAYLARFGLTQADVDLAYDSTIWTGVDQMMTYMNVDRIHTTEASQRPLYNLVKDLYKHARIETDEVVQKPEGYTVSILLYPIDVMGLVPPLEQMEIFFEREEDLMKMSAEAAEAEYIEECVELVRKYMPNMSYTDPVYIHVPVKIHANGAMEISQEVVITQMQDNVIKYYFDNAS